MFKSMWDAVMIIYIRFFFLWRRRILLMWSNGRFSCHEQKQRKTGRPQCRRWPGWSSRGPGPGPRGSGSWLFCCFFLLPAGPQRGWLPGPERERGRDIRLEIFKEDNCWTVSVVYRWVFFMDNGGGITHRCSVESNPKRRQKEKPTTFHIV